MDNNRILKDVYYYMEEDANQYDEIFNNFIIGYNSTLNLASLELLNRNFIHRNNDLVTSILDLGIGTGNLTKKILSRIDVKDVFAIDASIAMFDIASKKINRDIVFIQSDFRNISKNLSNMHFDYIVSSFALHHLNNEEKNNFIKKIYLMLNDKGSFILADRLLPEDSVQQNEWETAFALNFLSKKGVIINSQSISSFINEVNNRCELEGDKPSSLEEHITYFKNAGFANITVPCRILANFVIAGTRINSN